MKTLILGYGNPDRQDDGVAWSVVGMLAEACGLPAPALDDPLVIDPSGQLSLMVALQLVPEMAELVAQQERVCFVDAHTGRVPQDLSVERLESEFQNSPFTHHLTPQTCLALARELYAAKPEAWLVSVRGYAFNFSNELSKTTRELADQAVDRIQSWLDGYSFL